MTPISPPIDASGMRSELRSLSTTETESSLLPFFRKSASSGFFVTGMLSEIRNGITSSTAFAESAQNSALDVEIEYCWAAVL